MALALRLLLLLLLAVALHARAAQAAPVPARGAGEDRDLDYLEDDVLKFFWPPGGPPTGKNQLPGKKNSPEPFELLDKMLSELEQRRGEGTGNTSPAPLTENSLEPSGIPADMDQEMALWKAAAPEGGSDSLPESPEGRKAMPATGKPEVVGKAGTQDHNPQTVSRVLCPPDYRKRCMIAMLATLLIVPVLLFCCSFVVRKVYKNREVLIKLMMV
ncbi:uncharacterized protein LOC113977214 isoform X7 [Neopelma chrysocephalum]|uniref:uncharacterized protein LOC113977214 isoform X7 n=1 Tax=Neopelma chrysocephalum TaxID=114329 RepID=UPI000FCD4606|nr:uncharacterized protein LOC113977214 isoform X7 [Neopelma chrysocephalum]XP_027558932.1 uncharacterized protein LOC113977214 isoform X7 [Neopelma chrysocephalum]